MRHWLHHIKKITRFPVDELSRAFDLFLQHEARSGLVLLLCFALAMVWANSPWKQSYSDLWHHVWTIQGVSLFSAHTVINDGLMSFFFLLVGLEIKRAIYIGELSGKQKALFPAVCALGGILIPIILYLLLNPIGSPAYAGWGIPTATDIAFSLGILTLLGKRVPPLLFTLLASLAIVDDLGAIILIGFFYSHHFYLPAFVLALILCAILRQVTRMTHKPNVLHGLMGIMLWIALWKSGIHPTLAGVLLAATLPIAPKLEQALHPGCTYIIIPLFVLANGGVVIPTHPTLTSGMLGVILGLVIGKPLGIISFAWLAQKAQWVKKPASLQWSHILGMSFLAGIGFTMSLLMAQLSFNDVSLLNNAKLGVIVGSMLSASLGLVWLFYFSTPQNTRVKGATTASSVSEYR